MYVESFEVCGVENMTDVNKKAVWPGWETVRLIGRGSFGEVYEIKRDEYGHTEKAALKLISIPKCDSDIDELYSNGCDKDTVSAVFKSRMECFIDEYSLMRELSSSANIVKCDDYRVDEHDDTIGYDIFIKMELLTPLTKDLGKDIPDDQVVRIGIDICKALSLCKKHNIIHRDIKPANIFVSEDGDYKLGDFGIAKNMEEQGVSTRGIGTLDFMAPEVIKADYNETADIYSLGLVLYWLLNEKRTPFLALPPAFPTDTEKEQARSRRFSGEKLPDPVHGSEELKEIVLKACAFEPGDRYQSADEMLFELEQIDSAKTTAVFPENYPIEKKRNTKSKKRYLITCAISFALLAVTALIFGGKYFWGDWTVEKPASCENPGIEIRYNLLFTSRKETREIPALGHDWGEWLVVTQPGCETAGLEVNTCRNDPAHQEQREIAALEHDWSEWTIEQAASCEKPGLEVRVCSRDATHRETREIPALGHDWGQWLVVTQPGCETAGLEVRTCRNDPAHQEQREITALGHDWSGWTIEQDASCEKPGLEVRVCSRDATHRETKEIPALGHQWVAATFSRPETCSRCGETRGKPTPESTFPTVAEIEDILKITKQETVSTTGANLTLPDRESYLAVPYRTKIKASNYNGRILIMPMPDAENGNLGTIDDGTNVVIMARQGAYLFFITYDGTMGWNGDIYFGER